MVTTSRSIQGNTELTLLAPLKRGLAPKNVGQPTDFSYPSRLSLLLTTVFGDRKRELERDRVAEGLLEELQVIHSVQWAIVGQTEPQLLLAVTFDGPWETYIRTIVDRAGPLLDMIFAHCEGFEGNSCADGYQKFARWVRSRQIATEFLFGATDLTTDDIRFLKQFEQTFASDPSRGDLADVVSQTRLEPLRRGRSPRWQEKVIFLAKLAQLFPDEQLKFARMSALILQPEFGALTDPGPQDPLGQQLHQVFLALSEPRVPTAPAMAWFANLQKLQLAPAPDEARHLVEARCDVQGSILTPYASPEGGTTHGCVALLRFRGRAMGSAFLAQVASSLTTEPADPSRPIPLDSPLVNLGLTYAGLRSLGLDAQLLSTFPQEFREGLERRAGMLGDIGRNHPENWQLPHFNWPDMSEACSDGAADERVQLSMVDAVLVLQTSSHENGHELLPSLAVYLERFTAAVDILHVQPTRRFTTGGHFGLEDGISQPVARHDSTADKALKSDQVALGELLLGYPNERGEVTDLEPAALFKNSTFMALRKMSQDVAAYRSIQPYDNELALGRRASGTPLELDGLPSDPTNPRNMNDFVYPASPNESRCPHFAHVRRANPRNMPKPPRILRRGMSYGPTFDADADAPRGVMFMAIAASLAEQYEVVQRWVNAGNSTGVLSAHPDLIAGPFPEGSSRKLYYSNALGTGQIPLPERQPSVLQWGLYTFLPSKSALEWLATGGGQATLVAPAISYAAPADEGAAPNALLGPPTQAGAYAFEPDSPALKLKVFLEGGGAPTPEGAAYWRDVRAGGGVRVTPFAVLVASQQGVQEALLDSDKFSVRGYWGRMKACQAKSYLGMDPRPVALNDGYELEVREGDHRRESGAANEFLRALTREEAFKPALAAGRDWLKEQPSLPGGGKLIDFFAFGRRVIRDVAIDIFGLSKDFLSDVDHYADAGDAVRCPFDLTTAFLHIFPPRPSAVVSEQAVQAGRHVREAAEAYFAKASNRSDLATNSKFIHALRRSNEYGEETDAQRDERELRTLLGVLSGFAVPTNGHLVSVLVQLASGGELWRLQRELDPVVRRLKREATDRGEVSEYAGLSSEHVQFLYEPLYACMIRGAVPERLQRTAVADTLLEGVHVKRGDLLAVSIASAAEEAAAKGEIDAWKLLFGDLPASRIATLSPPRHPVHACPAQDVAIGVLLGALTALLEHRPLKPTADQLVLVG